MKKLYYLFSLCLLALSACAESSTDGADLELHCTSQSVMNFTGDGGEGVIEYTLTEKATRSSAAKVTATADVDWITIKSIESDRVIFLVALNEGSERSGIITLEYNGSYAFTMVEQARTTMPDKTFVATHLNGTYWGKFPTTTGFNYLVILGNKPSPHYLTIDYGAIEYRFNIYSDVSSAFNRTHRVPVGRYTIDYQSSGRPGTIDGNKDQSYYLTENGDIKYTDAVMVVTEDSIIVDVTLYGGEKHHVEYHGSLEYEGYTEGTFADIYPVSAHTEDITFDVTGGNIDAYFRGDYYGTGCNVWFMQLFQEKQPHCNGVYIILDLIVPKSAGGVNDLDIIVGEYPIFTERPDNYEYTIPTGLLRDDSLTMHAWYLTNIEGQIDMSTAAPLTSGSVKVTKDGTNFLFEIDSTDDNGNKLCGTFSGSLSDWQDQSCE